MRRGRRRARLVLAVLLLAAFGMITVDVREGEASPLRPARAAMGDVFGPVQQVLAGVVRPFSAVGDGIRLGSQDGRVEELEQANEDLRRQVNTAAVDKGRVEQLDQLMHLAGLGRYRIVPARVVAYGPAQGFAETATIDAGSRDGLTANMTVLNGSGLVGRVKTVSDTTATVVLATDPSVNVGVRLENMTLGFSTGNGAGPITVDLVDPAAVVSSGDRLVTFGSRQGTPFVSGVPFGTVSEVQGVTSSLAKRVKVTPFADFGSLDVVGVVVEPPRTDPRNSVLPPKPAPPPPPPAPEVPVAPQPEPTTTPSGDQGSGPSGTASTGQGRKPTGTAAPGPGSRPAPGTTGTTEPRARTRPTPKPGPTRTPPPASPKPPTRSPAPATSPS